MSEGVMVGMSAADPLNLTGIVMPGKPLQRQRISSAMQAYWGHTRRRYRDEPLRSPPGTDP